jgi:hypothetical protein
MGEGVGTAATAQGLGPEGIMEIHPPAGGRQGQGAKGARGTGAMDPGMETGRHRSVLKFGHEKAAAESAAAVK